MIAKDDVTIIFIDLNKIKSLKPKIEKILLENKWFIYNLYLILYKKNYISKISNNLIKRRIKTWKKSNNLTKRRIKTRKKNRNITKKTIKNSFIN